MPSAKLEERIERRVFPDPNTGCFLWGGWINDDGYGRIIDDGKRYFAHRLLYELRFGKIPEGMVVMHKCDNPACVNPAHLKVSTQAENVLDMYAKGRNGHKKFSGENSPNSKITEQLATYIRNCKKSVTELVKELSISKTQIYRIRRNESWKSV